MSQTGGVIAGPRITITQIEQEIKKSPLQVLTTPKSYSGKSNITIEGFDFRQLNTRNQKQCNVTDCQNVTIRRCVFGKKTTLGQGLNITGAKTKNIIVEYCIFEDMSFTESNGGEPCRLGYSQHSGISFNCTVRNCIFRNLRSDPETISIKTCGNLIEDNYFIDNKSNVTVRHGGLSTISHNLFRGPTNGVRIHGYGNKVLCNCFEANTETAEGLFAPIVARYGNSEKDPNWTSQEKPSEKEGNSHATYAQTVNTMIENNEFKNCKVTITQLVRGVNNNLAPKNTMSNNNKIVEKFSFEETSTPPLPPADKYGIKKLYPDATGDKAQVWYMNMDNPSSDPRFKNEQSANLEKEPDGAWSSDGSLNGKYQVRLEGWSESGQKKFLNCETTVYAQFMGDIARAPGDPGAYAYQIYRGGGHHSSNTPCEGAAYKARVRKDRSVVIVKEVLHPDYTSNKGGLAKLIKPPLGYYIGTKLVVYNLEYDAVKQRTPVKIEVWCDESGMDVFGKLDPAKQNWKKMAETIDSGGWASGNGGGCPAIESGNTGKRRPDEILNTPGGTLSGNLCAYRTDGVKSKIKFFSIREIMK